MDISHINNLFNTKARTAMIQTLPQHNKLRHDGAGHHQYYTSQTSTKLHNSSVKIRVAVSRSQIDHASLILNELKWLNIRQKILVSNV